MSDSFEAIDPDLHYFPESINSSCTIHNIDEFALKSRDKNFMNILNYNICSFHKNSNHFLPIVEQSKPHVLVLTETWFTKDYHQSIVNYNSYHTIRSSRASGGVSIFIIDDIKSRKID